MAGTEDSGAERRRHPRHPIKKGVRTTRGEYAHNGETADISAGGAAIEPTAELAAGDEVEIEINDVGVFQGRVARDPDDEFFAVAFDRGEDDEDFLVDEITRIHDGIVDEEY